MKHLRKYNESTQLDIDFAIVKIREYFSEEKVAEMVSKEISEWSDDDEFYSNNGNGEAEEVVIQEMINWFKREFSKPSNFVGSLGNNSLHIKPKIEESDFAALEDELRAAYDSLN